MKWKLFDHLLVHIVTEDFAGLGDTGGVIGCVAIDQRHVAEHIVNDHNRCISERFQERVIDWMLQCFGVSILADVTERNYRFLEEALELGQSCGATKEDVLKLVDYVYGRPAGDKHQEVGGVMVTLAALCTANGSYMEQDAERELARIWEKIDVIRAKHEAKVMKSKTAGPTPLPGETLPRPVQPRPWSGRFKG